MCGHIITSTQFTYPICSLFFLIFFFFFFVHFILFFLAIIGIADQSAVKFNLMVTFTYLIQRMYRKKRDRETEIYLFIYLFIFSPLFFAYANAVMFFEEQKKVDDM